MSDDLSPAATRADRELVQIYEEKIRSLMASPYRRTIGAIKRAFGLPHQSYEEYIGKISARRRRDSGDATKRPKEARGTRPVVAPASIPAEEIAARLDASDFPDISALIDAILAQRNIRSASIMLQHLATRGGDQRYQAALLYAELRFYEQLSMFSLVPDIAQRLVHWPELDSLLGAKAREKTLTASAKSLARLGRYDDSLKAIDKALWNDPGSAYLLYQKAEIAWTRDPQVAIEALSAAFSAGGAPIGPRLLYRALSSVAYPEALQEDLEFFATAGKALPQEFHLLFANLAGACGNLAAQRRHFDDYFGIERLTPCFAAPWQPLTFSKLGNPSLARERSGPLVSVLMTTFNSADTVALAVQSILDQSHGNLELLVVDDGSSDDTLAVLASLAARDERIRILANARNCGTYVAKNRALAEATGEFFTCQDSDDWSHPQRIAEHVRTMQEQHQLVATRSRWFRMGESTIEMRRWRNCFAHPSPTSTFCRIRVREDIGFFDSVRAGADSEHWFRIRSRYGPSSAVVMPATLSIGSRQSNSLTRAGATAMSEDNYSLVREAYTSEWVKWQRAHAADLSLHLPPFQQQRVFPVPPEIFVQDEPGTTAYATTAVATEITPAARGPEVVFGISLAARSVVGDWQRTCELLTHTLRSVLRQKDPRVRVLLCGHDRPPLAELDDPRVEFLVSDQQPARLPKEFRRDKMRKRTLIAMRLHELGGGYFFPLDADDLVSRQLVGHVLADDNRRGYLITRGYAFDLQNRRLAPVPGAWNTTYDRICGSSAVLYFDPADLPRADQAEGTVNYFDLFREHAYWPVTAEEFGRPLEPLPFPGGVYVINHGQNLSFHMQRTTVRQQHIIEAIATHQQEVSPALMDEFSLPLELGRR